MQSLLLFCKTAEGFCQMRAPKSLFGHVLQGKVLKSLIGHVLQRWAPKLLLIHVLQRWAPNSLLSHHVLQRWAPKLLLSHVLQRWAPKLLLGHVLERWSPKLLIGHVLTMPYCYSLVVADVDDSSPIGRKKEDLEHSHWQASMPAPTATTAKTSIYLTLPPFSAQKLLYSYWSSQLPNRFIGSGEGGQNGGSREKNRGLPQISELKFL